MKVEEYLRKWGKMLGDVHRFVLAKRQREREEAERQNDELRIERERREAAERRRRRRELEEVYDVFPAPDTVWALGLEGRRVQSGIHLLSI